MSGFELINQTLQITKDPEAQLFYTFDWSHWLSEGDGIEQSEYTVNSRVNDPDPLLKISEGIQGFTTYVELANGQVGKSYMVSVKITTSSGLIDRRSFRVKIENRSI